MPQGYVPPVAGGYPPALSATGSSPASSVEPYDYSSAIDPALEAAGPAHVAVPPPYDGSQGFRPDQLKQRGLGSASPYSSTASDTHNPRAKRIKIDDLLSVGGVVPPPLTPPSESAASLTPATLDGIKRFYSDHYALAIDDFLETRWFATRGLAWMLNDARLCEQIAALLERFRTAYAPEDVGAYALTQALETRVIWSLMCLCRAAATSSKAAADAGGELDARDAHASGLNEAVRRLSVFEDLLSGAVVDTNVADLARLGSAQHDPAKLRELEFWRLMGRFLTLRDDEASSAKEMDDALAGCRNLLEGRENRDVIYSIAIARHVGQRVAEFPNALPEAAGDDEQDVRHKLLVAKDFVEKEAAGRGTTLVIQRLCGMATRAWLLATGA
ncbi:MAG: hypothetical protein M1832_005052 [Thelocarpon impressellum]|nr:MAG: hypothetical protein M1832_005052 [Thelocarpon impressellum]